MLVPVLNINAKIKNFESFNAAFRNMIQNEVILSINILEIEEENDKSSGVALRAIDSENI